MGALQLQPERSQLGNLLVDITVTLFSSSSGLCYTKQPRSKHSWISLTRTNPIPLRLCMKSSDITMHAGDFARAFVVVLCRAFYVAQIDKSLPFFLACLLEH